MSTTPPLPAPLKYNTSAAFVGYDGIKKKQKEQLDRFREWARSGRWEGIHVNHYDWWMFPIDQRSGHGLAWTVYEGDVQELKKDAEYIANYLEGCRLLALAWGWDLEKGRPVPDPAPYQSWQNWPIRLYKCGRSLKLFGFQREFESLREYARDLLRQGTDMTYGGRDLSGLFK